jgi:hypothetical protein
MPDPPPAASPSYPNAPPPPESGPGGYPPQPYPGWQGAPPQQYRGPMLPAWLSFGGILVLVGGVLVLVGFVVGAFGNATYASALSGGSANSAQNYFNTLAVFYVLVGIGIFLAFLGWLFHQMSRHRQMGH